MLALYSSMRRLSSRWKGSADAGFSPIGGREQSAMAAGTSTFNRCAIARRFSRNHSGDGSVGRCLAIRKNRRAVFEQCKDIITADQDDHLGGMTREHRRQALERVIG